MLSPLQKRIGRIVREVPEAEEFALAGGAALIFRGDVDRTTQDLDFFATSPEAVDALVAPLEEALVAARLSVERVRVERGFVRLVVRAEDDQCLVDLAYDARLRPAEPSALGPLLAGEELAADKVLALYGRAQPRDFVDVFALVARFGRARLLELAVEKDRGFVEGYFADALRALDRLPRDAFEVNDATFRELRSFFAGWCAALTQSLEFRTGLEGRERGPGREL